MHQFPELFVLAKNDALPVADAGRFDDSGWCWKTVEELFHSGSNIGFLWKELIDQIVGFRPTEGRQDSFTWGCNSEGVFKDHQRQKTLFQLWNPATNTSSIIFKKHLDYLWFSKCSFGYDNLTDTYKIVYFHPNKFEILSFGCNVRKIIQLPNLVPLNCWDRVPTKRVFLNEDVSLNDTIILLARDIAQQIVIISLNLSTDTYSKLLPPQDFVEVSLHSPTLHVLEDSLYFSHHTQETHFIIWKMSEFGIENSWTQFLKVSYQDLNIPNQDKYFLAPLCLYESGVALVQAANSGRTEVILYNWSGNRIKKTRMDKLTSWMFNQNYVESLVPT
ncbi:uncharacterized protein LOC131642708 [Vicia villosa]|uniref:uncharacterized protein LOC131632281 n=1 Tax=Vicia villosa TaxID=3911 RepID=UPI00273AFB91|nr:uncharacterized protein LOC131632281 [Vicia villosa]XP_058768912.1 uncharacterized protein LOC131642708 [Vicia villosa]